MKRLSAEKMSQLIKRDHLTPNLKRNVSLLGYSTVLSGYRNYLPDYLGFSYQSFGVMSLEEEGWSMVNPTDIFKKVRFLLSSDFKKIDGILKSAILIFKETRTRFQAIKKQKLTADGLLDFLDVYEKYFGALGVYNAIFRTITDNNLKFPKKFQKRFGHERDEVGAVYPEVEAFLKSTVSEVGREIGVDGAIILNSVISEAREYLKSKKIAKKLAKEIKIRDKYWFYLLRFKKNEQYITSGQREIKKIYQSFFVIDNVSNEIIKGVSAFPGRVRGKIKILPLSNKKGISSDLGRGRIIVAVHTNPYYLSAIKKSLAIVTDEGGLLCHAAIISRELKKPCIIGTKIATKVFKDGDLVEVDANKGIVRKIK